MGTHHELLRTNAEYAWLMSGADSAAPGTEGAQSSHAAQALDDRLSEGSAR